MLSMKKYDVIIAGAGISGFAAAIGARQAGAEVLLFDRREAVGGTAVYALTPILSGWPEDQRGGGVADMLKEYLTGRGELIWRNGNADTEEDALQHAMQQLLEQAGVEVLVNAELISAKVADKKISSVTVRTPAGEKEIFGKNFVDASGDAALAVASGAHTQVPPVELSMTKTLMFKVKNLKSFDKMSIKERFRKKVFPVAHQNEFMGTQLLNDNEAVLNLTAAVGNAADPADHARMNEELAAQVPIILEWLRREFPEFADHLFLNPGNQ